ncbi:MAG: SRPBCC family protein [Actinomycetota bacterium]
MEISEEFEVARTVAAVWDIFQDVPAVAQCLPGATLTEDKGGNVYAGNVSVKLGPIATTFEGEAVITPDEASRRALIDGKGVDRRGGSRGQVKVTYVLTPTDGGGTKVAIRADVTIAGPAAQFGRTGLIQEMSRRLIADFVSCLEAKLAAPTEDAAAAIKAELRPLRLFWASLLAWLKRLFARR